MRWDAARNLNCLRDRDPKFGLVFMDPPYRLGLVAPALAHLHAAGCLAAGARLVVEHAAEDALPELGESGCRLADQRRYGITLVSLFDICAMRFGVDSHREPRTPALTKGDAEWNALPSTPVRSTPSPTVTWTSSAAG